jgi:hypothetical protein
MKWWIEDGHTRELRDHFLQKLQSFSS